MLFWAKSIRPLVLIDEDGKMIGVRTEYGRVVNKPRGSGYAVRIWLENDGDVATQLEAFERQGVSAGKRQAESAIYENWRVFLYSGDGREIVKQECDVRTVLILSKLSDTSDVCVTIDKDYLRHSGGVSINIKSGVPMLEHSRDAARYRPWGY